MGHISVGHAEALLIHNDMMLLNIEVLVWKDPSPLSRAAPVSLSIGVL